MSSASVGPMQIMSQRRDTTKKTAELRQVLSCACALQRARQTYSRLPSCFRVSSAFARQFLVDLVQQRQEKKENNYVRRTALTHNSIGTFIIIYLMAYANAADSFLRTQEGTRRDRRSQIARWEQKIIASIIRALLLGATFERTWYHQKHIKFNIL